MRRGCGQRWRGQVWRRRKVQNRSEAKPGAGDRVGLRWLRGTVISLERHIDDFSAQTERHQTSLRGRRKGWSDKQTRDQDQRQEHCYKRAAGSGREGCHGPTKPRRQESGKRWGVAVGRVTLGRPPVTACQASSSTPSSKVLSVSSWNSALSEKASSRSDVSRTPVETASFQKSRPAWSASRPRKFS